MAKTKSGSSFLAEMFSVSLYKRNQGRVTRQVTAVGFAIVLFYGAWTLAQGPLSTYTPKAGDTQLIANLKTVVRVGLPVAICAVGCWLIYRIVNYPRFADFLISVEAEMDKVSWASRAELIRATTVVLVTMVFLGAVLFLFDFFWQWFFVLIHFLELSGS